MSKRTNFVLMLLLVFVWFGASMLFSEFGVLNTDEAYYLTASHLVFHGQALYRDFAFVQGPLLPYVYGIALWLFGPSLAMGRFVSVGFSTLSFALVLNIVHRVSGVRSAVLAFILLIATPVTLYYFSIVKTYPLVMTLTLFSLALVLHSGSSASARWPFLSVLVAGLAAASRISFLPLVVLVFLFWVWRGRWRASGLGLFVLGILLLAVVVSSKSNFLFDVLGWHLGYVPIEPDKIRGFITLVVTSAIVCAPVLVLSLFLFMLLARVSAFRRRMSQWCHAEMDVKLLFLLVTIALLIVHLSGPAESYEYQIPSYFLAVVLLAAMSAPVGDLRDQFAWASLLTICLVAVSFSIWMYRGPAIWSEDRPVNTLQSAKNASDILAQEGKPGDTVLGEFNHLALASGLQVYPGNEMGLFSVADGSSLAETNSRHLLSQDAVTHALESCSATFIAISPFGLFPTSMPSKRDVPEQTRSQWKALLQAKYQVIYNNGEARIFERTRDKCGTSIVRSTGSRDR